MVKRDRRRERFVDGKPFFLIFRSILVRWKTIFFIFLMFRSILVRWKTIFFIFFIFRSILVRWSPDFYFQINSGKMVTRGGWEYVGSDGRLYKVKLLIEIYHLCFSSFHLSLVLFCCFIDLWCFSCLLAVFVLVSLMLFLVFLISLLMLLKTEFIADELGYRPVGEHIHPAFVQVQL